MDYTLRRKVLLTDLVEGRRRVSEVCDADTYLLRAARFHGEDTGQTCAVCRRENLTNVFWVFDGPTGSAPATARSRDEIASLAATREEFTVHEVEVCRSCGWNHLDRSFVLGAEPASGDGRRRRAVNGSDE